MTWILVLMLGFNGVTLTNIPGFVTKQHCEQAGQTVLNSYTFANNGAKYVCIPQPMK